MPHHHHAHHHHHTSSSSSSRAANSTASSNVHNGFGLFPRIAKLTQAGDRIPAYIPGLRTSAGEFPILFAPQSLLREGLRSITLSLALVNMEKMHWALSTSGESLRTQCEQMVVPTGRTGGAQRCASNLEDEILMETHLQPFSPPFPQICRYKKNRSILRP
jgi:hypothetical protein